MQILLIDDDKNLCHLTRIALTKHGFDLAVAHEAATGIKQAQQDKPSLILMDVMLPDISGAEAVRFLKSDPQLKDIPVVFLTGLISSGEKGIQEGGLKVDGLNYLTLGKPFEIEDLIEAVRKYAK